MHVFKTKYSVIRYFSFGPRVLFATAALCGLLVAQGCGNKDEPGPSPASASNRMDELTSEQLRNGIGPVTSVDLGEYNPDLANEGQELFKIKCSACHKIDQRYVGPALNDVLSRRTPAYVMNMILNPEEMVKRHPEAKKLLAEYAAPMANQHLTQEEARAIVEFLRNTNNNQSK
ncbi:MAG: cytochrome c [Bacteroidetes bacterium]|nr:cytochrome c [Bacteroidota bacterium]